MIVQSVLFIVALSLSACISQIPSAEDWAKPSIGLPIEHIERMNERDGTSWYAVKRVSSNRTIYTLLGKTTRSGQCYIDFTVNSYTGLIVDYYIYGDKSACE